METNAYQIRERGPKEIPGLARLQKVLSPDEKGELEIVSAIRKVMDEAVTVPGTNLKVGLDAIIGLIPGVGDISSAAIGAYLLRAAARLNVPTIVMARMLFNLLIDTIIGIIPFVGDYFDVLYKANAKNARLLEATLENRQTAARSSWWKLIGALTIFALMVVGGFIVTVLLAKWAWSLI